MSKNTSEKRPIINTSQPVLKPATLPAPRAPRSPIEPVQPAPKRLKGASTHNRYEALSIDDDDEEDSSEESGNMSTEEYPELPETRPIKNTTPRSKSPQIAPVEKPTKERVPPIVLHQKELWSTASKKLSDSQISFSKAKTIAEGISIQPSSADDYRATINILNNLKAQYHTYQLPSEKLLHVILRGVPEPLTDTEIRQELEENGFHPEAVTRLRRYKEKSPMPLVLVTVPKSEKNIFNLQHVSRVVITVESQKPKTRINQCFRCQRFGHAQSRCTVMPKCVKCAGDHHYTECTKSKDAPAKCANCGESHTASYRGCRSWPQPKKQTLSKPTSEGPSYAQATKQNTQTAPSTISLTELFTSFQTMYSQMQEIAKKLSEMFTTNKPPQ